MSTYSLDIFPPPVDLETPPVLRALVQAHRYLAELKGIARTIPNEGLLISTLSGCAHQGRHLGEAQAWA